VSKGRGAISLDRDNFYAFAGKPLIATKDEGLQHIRPARTQVYLIDRVIAGLKRGIHTFKVLKCRQAYASTVCLILDLYWCFKFGGVTGSIIADHGDRMAEFRKIIGDMVGSLPDDPDWRQPVEDDNRYMIAFANRSSLRFWNANQRESGSTGKLGRGVGVNLIHASECGFWKNQSALESIAASMSDRYEHRLYLWESTANGFNVWAKMCDVAQKSVTEELVFIGWWLQDVYSAEAGSDIFKTYWDNRVNEDERRRIEAVQRRFGVTVSPEQIAWYRWKLDTQFFGNEEQMWQEFPWTPEDAFRYSGSKFVSVAALNNGRVTAETNTLKARYFRFRFSTKIEDTQVEEVEGVPGYYDLCAWRPPNPGGPAQGVIYVMGADPSYGSNERSDEAVIQVVRCYADKLEQVAEFSMRNLPTYQLAWVCLMLAGLYQVSTFNLELQGGGITVMDEVRRIQQDGGFGYSNPLQKHFESLQHFMYHRADSLSGAACAWHTKSTTAETRESNLNRLRDFLERGLIVINSVPLLDEMATLMRDSDSGQIVCRDEHDPDNRCMAMGFALAAFWEVEYYNLKGTQFDWDHFAAERATSDAGYVTGEDLIAARVNAYMRMIARKQGALRH
jgi:hypothetical protein